MEDGLANWQWLTELSRMDQALLIVADDEAPDWFLTLGFTETRRLVAGRDSLDALAPESVDCIAVPDAAVLTRFGLPRTAALRRLRRALRPGSGVYVGIQEIHSSDGSRSIGAAFSQMFNRQSPRLRRAGFQQVQRYFIVQSPASPRNLVPATSRALIAWDTAISAPDWRMRLRHLLYRLGLTAMLLRYRLVIARA